MADTSKNLRIYNTLTRKQEPFVPIDPGHVRMYVCGPTVYDYAHIGNARPVIVFDVLFRLLRHLYGEDHVTYVRNITDVDDKINARARDTYPDLPLNEAIRKVTEATARQFHEDVAALGCLTGELVNKPGQPKRFIEPRATETIPEMIAIIQKLLDNGNAYVAQGEDGREALFDVLSMPEYGELSKRNLEEQQSGARVAVEPHKRNPADFVLWKESSPAEPGWDANFVISDVNRAELRLNANFVTIRGRPGWHIECSAMSDKWLWEAVKGELSPEGRAHPHEFDIHGGGIDLTFPHHENEIAQSRCAHGTPVMARYWMHNGFLQVEGQKMSKSLGNFVTINELLATKNFGSNSWHGYVLRLSMLNTRYREPIDWTVERLVESRRILRDWIDAAFGFSTEGDSVPDEIVEALADDLNTPRAVATIHLLHKLASRRLDPEASKRLGAALRFLGIWAGEPSLEIYGYGYEVSDVPSDREIREHVARRTSFIREKNWAEADRIRDELLAEGIQLKDGKDPQTGERVTTWEVKR